MKNFNDIFQKYDAVVFVDTETTGLDIDTCRIIELAALRFEKTQNDTLCPALKMDLYIKLPEGEKIPDNIVKLTGITDMALETQGSTESYVAKAFTEIIREKNGPVLIVAHNTQFDLLFLREMLRRNACDGLELLETADYLDSLTVFKNRREEGAHKLQSAVEAYNLQNKVKNFHSASADVVALFEVCKAMDAEKSDLLAYVNIFGYNPKRGIFGYRLDKVVYWPQYLKTKKSGSPTQTGSHSSTATKSITKKKQHFIITNFLNIFNRLKKIFHRPNAAQVAIVIGTIVAVLIALILYWSGYLYEITDIEQFALFSVLEEQEKSEYIFKDGYAGTPVNIKAMTEAWAAEAGFEKRYDLTDAERWEIASVVTAEAVSEPFAGKVAVAQCVLQACEDDGIRPVEVLVEYGYCTDRPEPCEEALEAVAAVFDFGQVVTCEPIKYFYAPKRTSGDWHETQVYIITINNHKFFKEAK